MIITVRNMPGPGPARARLAALAERFPVGQHVRHETGWTGLIVADTPGRTHGHGLGAGVHHTAHCLTGSRPSDTAVCVEWTVDGRPVAAWYRPSVLTPVGKDAAPAPKPAPKPKPAPRPKTTPRKRTWRAA